MRSSHSVALPPAPAHFRLNRAGKVDDGRVNLAGLVTFERVPDAPARPASAGSGGTPQ